MKHLSVANQFEELFLLQHTLTDATTSNGDLLVPIGDVKRLQNIGGTGGHVLFGRRNTLGQLVFDIVQHVVDDVERPNRHMLATSFRGYRLTDIRIERVDCC